MNFLSGLLVLLALSVPFLRFKGIFFAELFYIVFIVYLLFSKNFYREVIVYGLIFVFFSGILFLFDGKLSVNLSIGAFYVFVIGLMVSFVRWASHE